MPPLRKRNRKNRKRYRKSVAIIDKTTRYDTLTYEEYMRFRNSGKDQKGSSIDEEKVQQ